MYTRSLQQVTRYAVIIFLLAMVACKDKREAPAAPPPPSVVLQEVSLTDAIYYDQYPATVNALNQVELRPQVSGFITGVYFADGSRVEALSGQRNHTHLRTIKDNVTIGPGIVLPSEVQLGSYAIIPTLDSIAQIGRFGESRRMVTVYGSEDGPLYGVGCQFGIDGQEFRGRILDNRGTSEESAADYGNHFGEIESLGTKVQQAYEREGNLVNELLDQRAQAFADIFRQP